MPADAELVLRVADALLELPAVGGRLARLDPCKLRLRILELLLCTRVVDLPRGDRVVDERDRPVLEHLEEAWARRELVYLTVAHVHACRARLQHCDERCVAGEHADLAGVAGD